MAEFLIRGWNVAIPEVDVGDDIFVVQDEKGEIKRVQVKTATAKEKKNGYSAQFNVQLKQIQNDTEIDLVYVFVVRNSDQWTKPVIISQNSLKDYFKKGKLGEDNNGMLNLHFSYSNEKVACRGIDLSKYVSDFSEFPLATRCLDDAEVKLRSRLHKK